MSDELATAIILIVTAFITIAAGFAWWVNRPQRTHHAFAPRIQPLFAAETVGAVAGGADELDDVALAARGVARGVPGADVPNGTAAHDASRNFDRAGPSREASGDDEDRAATWESAAAMAQRNAQQAATLHRTGAADGEGVRGVPSPPAWAGGALRHEQAQAMPQRVPMQPHLTRADDRRAGRPVDRLADRQPERFAQGMGGTRQSRVGEFTTGGSPPPVQHAPVAPQAWNEGQSVRFSVPTDGTLQFLPGRLEITAGQDKGREIRFVRLPNAEPEITFGRNEGAPYRHVQLRDGTVSRLHARMRLHEGRWTLTNLSTTNPVGYNGRVLGDGEEQPLEQDDRIEMGEVAFRFRSR